jgi:hypothetical protein
VTARVAGGIGLVACAAVMALAVGGGQVFGGLGSLFGRAAEPPLQVADATSPDAGIVAAPPVVATRVAASHRPRRATRRLVSIRRAPVPHRTKPIRRAPVPPSTPGHESPAPPQPPAPPQAPAPAPGKGQLVSTVAGTVDQVVSQAPPQARPVTAPVEDVIQQLVQACNGLPGCP